MRPGPRAPDPGPGPRARARVGAKDQGSDFYSATVAKMAHGLSAHFTFAALETAERTIRPRLFSTMVPGSKRPVTARTF